MDLTGGPTAAARATLMQQQPCVVWFTGLSGAGKSTIANLVDWQLHQAHCRTLLLDGDDLRRRLNRDLGFTDADRAENVRRLGEVARLLVDAGLIVLVSAIAPLRVHRRTARDLIANAPFFEIFVDVPLHVAEARDPKGLYREARAGRLPRFTGIDSPYESPERPELRIDGVRMSPAAGAEAVMSLLARAGVLDSIGRADGVHRYARRQPVEVAAGNVNDVSSRVS
jgi:adenylyl-sulfate kinase